MNHSHEPHQAVTALAEGALGNDPEAAWSLIEAAWPLLIRFVLYRLRHQGLPNYLLEDGAQAVMERVWKYRRSYRGHREASFWAWLRRICDNERKRAWAREKKQPVSESTLQGGTETSAHHGLEQAPLAWGAESARPDKDADLEEQEVVRALIDCLSRLNNQQGRIIALMYLKTELTERAAAEVLNRSPSYIHKLKMQALEALRMCLESKGID